MISLTRTRRGPELRCTVCNATCVHAATFETFTASHRCPAPRQTGISWRDVARFEETSRSLAGQRLPPGSDE